MMSLPHVTRGSFSHHSPEGVNSTASTTSRISTVSEDEFNKQNRGRVIELPLSRTTSITSMNDDIMDAKYYSAPQGNRKSSKTNALLKQSEEDFMTAQLRLMQEDNFEENNNGYNEVTPSSKASSRSIPYHTDIYNSSSSNEHQYRNSNRKSKSPLARVTRTYESPSEVLLSMQQRREAGGRSNPIAMDPNERQRSYKSLTNHRSSEHYDPSAVAVVSGGISRKSSRSSNTLNMSSSYFESRHRNGKESGKPVFSDDDLFNIALLMKKAGLDRPQAVQVYLESRKHQQ
mmetsp:Transcript_12104/g.16619  ORF Transcript_12104/g.16619 Transcript_12104/m.16619 type:complete len:288 (-) Transcript_12104:3159-4022(-)